MRVPRWLAIAALLMLSLPAFAAEEPKRGGTLTYLIPADAPPSFDGHRETTYATVHSVSPFYSVLIRINPENPSSTTDFVCDLCTAIPQPRLAWRLPRWHGPAPKRRRATAAPSPT